MPLHIWALLFVALLQRQLVTFISPVSSFRLYFPVHALVATAQFMIVLLRYVSTGLRCKDLHLPLKFCYNLALLSYFSTPQADSWSDSFLPKFILASIHWQNWASLMHEPFHALKSLSLSLFLSLSLSLHVCPIL